MAPAFQRVALIGKQTPEIAQSLRALRDLLRQRGCEVMLERDTAASVGEKGAADANAAAYDEIGRSADLAIVLGGDGTMLSAARNPVILIGRVSRSEAGWRQRVALASAVHGGPKDFLKLVIPFMRLGPAGWHRYFRDSRILERVGSRIKAGLA